MDGPFQPAQENFQSDGQVPSLVMLARNVRGAAQLLALVADVPDIAPSVRAGLDLLANNLARSADQAEQLIEDVGINISDHLGITTDDLANMRFAPVSPEFRREPESLPDWKDAAEVDFNLWGEVESILAEDDMGLEQRFLAAPDDNLDLVDALEQMRERGQHNMKLLEATLLRLAVSVARWEQSGEV